jgi:hypothetical protein
LRHFQGSVEVVLVAYSYWLSLLEEKLWIGYKLCRESFALNVTKRIHGVISAASLWFGYSVDLEIDQLPE